MDEEISAVQARLPASLAACAWKAGALAGQPPASGADAAAAAAPRGAHGGQAQQEPRRFGAGGVGREARRSSPIVELSLLLAECVQHGLRTIAFCKTRKLCELVTAYVRETLRATAPHLAGRISVYRAGYRWVGAQGAAVGGSGHVWSGGTGAAVDCAGCRWVGAQGPLGGGQ